MTKSVKPLKRRFRVAIRAAFIILLTAPDYLLSAQLSRARVTQVINDMTLLPLQTAPKPAAVNDEVGYGTVVRTGTRSRGELIFTDQTLVRLGANTIFSFKEGTRIMELGGGAMLLQVPKNATGAKITTGVMTSAISGTVMLKYDPDGHLKFIVLEGIARLSPEGVAHRSLAMRAGQCRVTMLKPQLAQLGDVVEIDLKRVMETSLLIKGFPPLESEYLIEGQVRRQSDDKSNDQLIAVGLLANATDAVDQAAAAQAAVKFQPNVVPPPVIFPSPTPTPSPTPSARRASIRVARGPAFGGAINPTNSGQLLSPPGAATPGHGGNVTISAKDANSVAKVKGTVQANIGVVDVLRGHRP